MPRVRSVCISAITGAAPVRLVVGCNMRVLSISASLILLAGLVISCSGPAKPPASVDISLRNATDMSFDEVKLYWENLIASRSDDSLFPSNFTTILWGCDRSPKETAELRFVEHKSRQPHSITVSVAPVSKTLSTGKHEVVVCITALDQAHVVVDGPPCCYNLLVTEAAKQKWEMLHNKSRNDVPSWVDLRADFPQDWRDGMPVCPAGGTYTIGRLGEDTKCSVSGEGHTLP